MHKVIIAWKENLYKVYVEWGHSPWLSLALAATRLALGKERKAEEGKVHWHDVAGFVQLGMGPTSDREAVLFLS